MKFSIVIPTYNREEDLRKCTDSICKQTKKPSELIIIDDGDLNSQYINDIEKNLKNNNIDLIYYKKNHQIERRGLSESKNRALELVNNKIFFILDDDVVLLDNFCEKIISVWGENKNDNLIGVGGIIKNRRKKYFFEKYYYKLFGISSKYEWDVNKIGFQIWDEEIKERKIGYYSHGGVCLYDRDKVKELKFSTFSGGRTALEDVDFCLRAKNNDYSFIIEPSAQLYHYPSNSSRESLFLMGFKESYNRRIIFKNQNKKPNFFIKIWFYWANIGWILRQFIVGNFAKGKGLIKGLFVKIN